MDNMSNYHNVSYSTTREAKNYVNKNWVHSSETNFLQKHILTRGANFFLAPASFITSAVDTIIGLGIAIAAVFDSSKIEVAKDHLSSSKKLFVRPYVNLLRIINPEVKFFKHDPLMLFQPENPPIISAEGNGLITEIVFSFLRELAWKCSDDSLSQKGSKESPVSNFLLRHVASPRLTYALLAVSCLVTRAADLIIGIPAGVLSILTGGMIESLNNLAYRALQAPGIIDDLFYCTIKIIDPSTVI